MTRHGEEFYEFHTHYHSIATYDMVQDSLALTFSFIIHRCHDVPSTRIYDSSLSNASYHKKKKKLNWSRPIKFLSGQTSGALILITKKTGTSQEQTLGLNHEYQCNSNGGKFPPLFGLNRMKPNCTTSKTGRYWPMFGLFIRIR